MKPRRYQLDVAETIYYAIRGGSSVALDAPTGWGKTIVTLVALKAANMLPALWLVSRLPIGFRVGGDAELLELKTFIAAGREKCCLAPVEREDVHDYCRLLRYRCEFFLNLSADKIPGFAASYEDLVDVGKNLEFCPYYAQDFLIGEADVVVQSYFRRRSKTYKMTVYDEVHNFLMPMEITIRIDDLNDVIKEMKNCPLIHKETVNDLLRFKSFVEDNEGILDVRAFFREESISEMRLAYKYYLQNNARTSIGRLLRVIGSDVVYSENKMLVGVRATRFTPRKPFIALSGTFLPEIRKFLGADVEIAVPRKKYRAYILNWVTSRYTEFEEHVEEYRLLLFKLKKTFNRVVVFGTDRVLQRFLELCDYYEEEFIRSEIPETWSGVLFLKSRGRFSEGVDVEADAVVLLGAPYLTPEVIQRLAKTYRRLGYEDYWALATDIPMLITTLQCIGRTTRNPEDKPLILLADSRYGRFKQLEKYLELEEISLDKLDKLLNQNKVNN